MILHPGILALELGSALLILMLLYSAGLSIKILRHWDINSSSELQLNLERKTYLTSTIINYLLGYQIVSAILFIYTVDGLHTEFVGAMCATGTLNANPIGWYVLYLKILNIFIASIWIGINVLDQRSRYYPLTRLKSAGVLIMLPVFVLDGYLQTRYFLGLDPAVITSCCGALFSSQGSGLASTLSGMPIRLSQLFFLLASVFMFITGLLSLKGRRGLFKYLYGISGPVFFLVSISAIISFVSLYFYELPTHHCPFDILQADYHLIGYPLYITLFLSAVMAMLTGIYEALKSRIDEQSIVQGLQRKLIVTGLIAECIFIAICLWPILFSSFTLKGYYL